MSAAFLVMGLQYLLILCLFLICTFWKEAGRILERIGFHVSRFLEKSK